MAYLYEQAGAQRFVQLCRALVAPDHEPLELLELGRPDATRYGYERFPDVADKVVLQVAFEPDPRANAAAHAIAALEAELPKIRELARRAARRYIFATNLPRPAPPGADDPDAVAAWLAANCPVPATLLWRADVDRRIDWAPPATSLAFPEILERRDAVATLLELALGPAAGDALGALIELVAAAYRRDSVLIGEFVDVPVRGDDGAVAAAVLLAEGGSAQPAWRLLEGESGSGKSTVARSVSCIHAARLLEDRALLASAEADHVRTSFRVPLTIDARDYAAHLESTPTIDPKRGAERAFESFVQRLLAAASESAIAPSAVRRLLRVAPWWIVLDGLDDVGDTVLGERITSSMLRALSALQRNGADIQFVLATRPAGAGSIASRERTLLSPLALGPLGVAAAVRLCERWSASRGIGGTQADAVRDLFGALVASASFRDLAGNPLMLRKLLELLPSRGVAVPDRRHELLTEHERWTVESDERSLADLREHRHLVAEFGEFLALALHEDAASPGPAFGVSHDALASLGADFLDAGGHPSHLLEHLLAAARRLPYLDVSTTGTLRFRERSTREFLAARRLSTTSTDWRATLGALVGHPHWSEVARSMAGSVAPADFDVLVASVREWVAADDPAVSLGARELGRAMLWDRVLRSRPDALDALVHVVFGDAGAELASLRPHGAIVGELGEDRGAEALRDLLMRDYLLEGSGRMRESVARLVRLNGGHALLTEFESHAHGASGAARTERLSAMFRAGAHRDATVAQLESLIYDDQPDPRQLYLRLTALLDARTSAFIDSPRMTSDLIAQLLAWGATGHSDGTSRLAAFATVVADGKSTVAVIEGLAVARDYDSAAIAIEAIRTEFGDSWATFSLAAAACGIPRHSGVGAAEKSLMDPSLPLCDRALAARLWRGKSAWWAEELGRATSVQERMFWAVVLVAWGSANYVTDHLALLDSTLAALDEDEYLLVAAAIQTALRAREVHGGRPRPLVEPPEWMSVRGAIVTSIALAPGRLRGIDLSRVGAPIARFAESTIVAERLREFTSWSGMDETGILEWCDTLGRANELAAEIPEPVIARFAADPMPGSAVRAMLRSPQDYPEPLVALAILTAESGALGTT